MHSQIGPLWQNQIQTVWFSLTETENGIKRENNKFVNKNKN